MNKYLVKVPMRGTKTVEVLANSPDEAEEFVKEADLLSEGTWEDYDLDVDEQMLNDAWEVELSEKDCKSEDFRGE